MRLKEIEERLAAIKIELEGENVDVDALEKEVNSLTEERKQIREKAEKRKALLDGIAKNTEATVIATPPKGEGRMADKLFTPDTKEYRNAWLNNMRGVPVSDVEQRALSAAGVVPVSTANIIIDRLVDMVPLLNEIELFRVRGNVTFNVQTAIPIPTIKAGGSAVDEATTTLTSVSLTGYTISTIVAVGADLGSMAIDAFEAWLTSKLAEGLAYKIEDYIVNGDGDSAPTGLKKASVGVAWADTVDAVDWYSTALGVVDLDEAIGMLPASYDRNAKFLMSKKTFFNSVVGLQDVNNYPVVRYEGGTYYIRGYKVIFSDKVKTNDIYFGDLKRAMAGNLGVDFTIERDRNLRYNSWDFLGWCVFDCKPAAKGTVIKIAADIT